MNSIVKYSIAVLVTALVATVILIPIVTNADKYKVVIANTSERPITSLVISGGGIESPAIGPIAVGDFQDYLLTPLSDGELKYSIVQDKKNIKGVINPNIKKGEVGDIFIVVGELYKIKILDEYDAAY